MTRLLTLGNSRSGFVVASTLMSNVFESSCVPYASTAASGEIDNPASKQVAHGVGISNARIPDIGSAPRFASNWRLATSARNRSDGSELRRHQTE